MTFHVGQKVVCVDDYIYSGESWPLRKGVVYTVKRIGSPLSDNHWDVGFLLSVELEEIGNPYHALGDWYDARRFRPAVQPRKELPESITKYLNVPGRVDA